jgi:hypothetical protein
VQSLHARPGTAALEQSSALHLHSFRNPRSQN